MQQEDYSSLEAPVDQAAQRLLGCELVHEMDGKVLRAMIVETEAYHQDDPASHAITGPDGRAKSMFLPAGHLYVYFTYGMHYCCNIVSGQAGEGAGVLVRAVEPLEGYDEMIANRGGKSGYITTNGPGKVCQALAIDRQLDGHNLAKPPVRLLMNAPLAKSDISVSSRIGISKAVDTPWRFYVKDNPYVSKYPNRRR